MEPQLHLEMITALESTLGQAVEDVVDLRSSLAALGDDFGTEIADGLRQDYTAAQQRVLELSQDLTMMRAGQLA